MQRNQRFSFKKKCVSFFGQWLLFAFVAVFSVFANSEQSRKIKIVYLAQPQVPFWSNFSEFLLVVGRRLDMEIITIDSQAAFPTLAAVKKIAQSDINPDFLLFHLYDDIGDQILDITEAAGIKTFTVTSDLTPKMIAKVGRPREIYKHWIGHLSPDDEMAGYQLADAMIDARKKIVENSENEEVKLIGINGWHLENTAQMRGQGLKKRVGEDKNLDILRLIHTNWDIEHARESSFQLLQQFEGISLIWCANDSLALAAAESAKKIGLTPGKDIFIGGIDWTSDGINAVKEGELVTTLGGHHMQGGWALVLLHDYFYNIDFSGELGIQIKMPLHAINASQADRYLKLVSSDQWKKIDFKKYSRYYNPDIKKYDFSLDALLSQLEK